MSGALQRLVTYGTLAPGGPNHGHLNDLRGRWIDGHVHGRLVQAGWGADLGYPALVLDDGAPRVEVQVFESVDLREHWSRLDDFEGPGYRRAGVTVHTGEGDLDATIYVLASPTTATSE
jgi:gamma-glutamylcyclotransferase (GGCT)/AIG2-like uncharacterized protein YtfP